jgi:hypothetical protein
LDTAFAVDYALFETETALIVNELDALGAQIHVVPVHGPVETVLMVSVCFEELPSGTDSFRRSCVCGLVRLAA